MNEEDETPEAKAHRESQERYAEARRIAAELEQREQTMQVERERQEALLVPKLTDEFLETLVHAARVVGWGVDHWEVISFVQEVFALTGKDERPSEDELRPFYDPSSE